MDAMAKDGIRLQPRPGGFGCEVWGLDLARGVSEATFRRIERAWFDHSFLIYRDLQMTPAQHVAWTRRFGPLHIMVPTDWNLPEHPEIFVVGNAEREGKPLGLRRAGMGWHSDGEDKRIPNAGSMLYAKEIPPSGGDTLFADMYAAYEALPEALRQRIAGRRGRFSRIDMHQVHYPHLPPLSEADKRARPDVFHPLVRRHPGSGRPALFVGRWTRDVEGMEPEEGRALVEELFAHATQDRFVYRHVWRPRDAVQWDNRCMLHCATGFDEQRSTRLMHRTTLEGVPTS